MPTPSESPAPALKRAGLCDAYRIMKTIREFEERVHIEFAAGRLPGVVHLYAGQEACAAGVCLHLSDDDYIASTHRGHGHCLAKRVDVRGMMAELFGRSTGVCRGKGGSMHVADWNRGMIGANGIVGAGPPLACGAALALQRKGRGHVAVAFFGDGASNQGSTLESLNLAVIWKLPVVFVIEDNGYAETTASQYAIGAESNVARARGFGLPAVEVDGHDFFAVHAAAGDAIARARRGDGPSLIDCQVSRFYGHFEGDRQTYRPADEIAAVRATRDCLAAFSTRVVNSGLLDPADIAAIDREVGESIEDAVRAAQADPPPQPADLFTDVYGSY